MSPVAVDSLQVLLLLPDPESADLGAAALIEQRLRHAGLAVTPVEMDGADKHLRRAKAGILPLAAVVIGPGLPSPIAAARQVRTQWPQGHILFAPAPEQRPALQALLRYAPRVGTDWSLSDATDPDLATTLIKAAKVNARRKQVHSALERANEQLAQARTQETRDYQRLLQQVELLAQEKEKQRRLYEAALASTTDQSYLLNLEGRLILANRAMAEQLEVPQDQLLGRAMSTLGWASEHEVQLQRHLAEVIDHHKPVRAELPFTAPSGKAWVFEYILTPVLDDSGALEAIAGTSRDVTQRKKSDERVWREANYDALTGLPNRRLFRDRLTQEIRHCHRKRTPMALFFIDLDRFKQVNDLHGHDAGDSLLIQVADRINTCVREADTVARLGGDEFTVILTELDDDTHVEHTAQKILEELARPFQLEQATVHISGSIGITLYPRDALQPEELIRNADQAMYIAKNAGRSRFSFFTRQLQVAALQRLRLVEDLRSALADDQFRLYFQPILSLHDGRIHKAEALLRWIHPNRGLLSPTEFISLAEESGQIDQLGNWVFRQAADYTKAWSTLLGRPFQVSINKSPLQFTGESHKTWIEYLDRLRLARSSITVEITEGVLLNASAAVTRSLAAFQRAGIEVAIDDFGTGYASMAYLKKYDVDYLKIDQSFVQDMVTNTNSYTIIEGIVAMAHKLGLKTIAEGIETEAQHAALRCIGCDFGQGFLFSKPLPADSFEQLLLSSFAEDPD